MLHLPILEPANFHGDPPGSCLFDPPEVDEDLASQSLKRHPKHIHIILRPQPSSSTRDPLNWTRFKKEVRTNLHFDFDVDATGGLTLSLTSKQVFFLVLLLGSTCTGVIGPILVPAFGIMSVELGVPVAKVAQLNGILVLFEGIASAFIMVTAAFWGRRSAYLATTALQLGGCLWGGAAKSYNSLYGARIVMGMGMSAYAVLIGSSIADVFFTYEHGARIALWQVTYIAAVQVTPIISAAIVTKYNWRYTFWILSAFLGVTLLGIFFFTPESKFLRDEDNKPRPTPSTFSLEAGGVEKPNSDSDLEKVEQSPISSTSLDAPPSFVSSLKFWGTIRDTKDSVLITMLRPILIILSPALIYSTLVYTVCFSWFVYTGATYSQIYSGMVYHESAQAVGNIAGISPLIGTLLACLLSGPLTDYSARWLSVRNHGVFEPEYRLVVLVPAFISFAIGGFGWAGTANVNTSIYASTVLSGFQMAGSCLGICAVVGYANSCFPKRGGEGFGMMMLLSRAYIFGGTYYINQWLAEKGVLNFFGVLTGITLGLFLLGIPMYIFGKKMRASFASGSLGWVTQ